MNDDDELKSDFSEKNMDHVKVSKLKVELLNNLFLSEVNQKPLFSFGGVGACLFSNSGHLFLS